MAFSMCLLLVLSSLVCIPAAKSVGQSSSTPVRVQANNFNATLGSEQHHEARSIIEKANVTQHEARYAQIAVDFERSNWAGESVHIDSFYNLPGNISGKVPGSVLKVEHETNPMLYTLPASVSMSRMLFQSETVDGKPIPASAYVLWPYMPREFDFEGFPVVTWAHGTSGLKSECAPSHIRNLWYQYSAPFLLALQGYVVVAADYSGLGIDRTEDGEFIPHQWGYSAAQGNDVVFAVEAARKAFPSLSKEFVVMGHSQGGGAAWGAAERLAKHPVSGYLGTVAGSPLTNIKSLILEAGNTLAFRLSLVTPTMSRVLKDFQISDWLTPYGVERLGLYQSLSGCQSVAMALLQSGKSVRQDWKQKIHFLNRFNDIAANGGKPFAGPMLVLQGTEDTNVPHQITETTVNQTCSKVKDAQIEFHIFKGVSHVPALFAGQQIWLNWINDRFSKVEARPGCTRKMHAPPRSIDSYQPENGYFLEWPKYAYEVA